MKLTGGSFKGRRISRKGLGTQSEHGALRATGAKVREAVFDIIGPSIEGAVFADLYAGSGAVGMEAMSRGASAVYFVEADRQRARVLEETLDGCGCRSKAIIRNMPVEDFIMAGGGSKLNVVFLDPPYRTVDLGHVLGLLGEHGMLDDVALVLVEHEKGAEMPVAAGGLQKYREYKYGDTALTTYRKA